MAESKVILAIAAVIVTGSLNNVVGKIKSKPLGRYNVLAAFLNAIVYTIAYALFLLFQRHREMGLRILSREERAFLKAPTYEVARGVEEAELQVSLLRDEGLQRTKSPERSLRTWWDKYAMFKWFIFIGAMESIGSVMGLMAQSVITGPLYALSLQSIIVFSAILGYYALGTKYSRCQVFAMFLVLMGACVSLLSQYKPSMTLHMQHSDFMEDLCGNLFLETRNGVTHKISEYSFLTTMIYAGIAALSTLPTASSYASKEHLFQQYTHYYPSMTLSIFTVGFLSSLMAACFLPVALLAQFYFTRLDGNPATELLNGFSCLVGRTPANNETDCTWAPVAYVTYIAINVCFNFSLLHLVKISSSLVTFLSMKTVLPVAILIFATVPLPLLEQSDQKVSPLVLVGLALVLCGLALYQKVR